MADRAPTLDGGLTRELINFIKAEVPTAWIRRFVRRDLTRAQRDELNRLVQAETSNEFPDILSMSPLVYTPLDAGDNHIHEMLIARRPEPDDLIEERRRTYGDWLIYILESSSIMEGQGRNCMCRCRGALKGGAKPTRDEYYNLVYESYHESAAKEVDGWSLVAESPTIKIYNKGTEYVVSIRGTYDSEDAKADAMIAFNSLEKSSRFQKDLKFLGDFIKSHPGEYYGTAHSLGGAILDLFLRKGMIKEGQSYNPAVQPQDFRNTLANHRIFMEGDPLYTLVRLFLYQKPEVIKGKQSILRTIARLTPIGNLATSADYLQSHKLKQFKGKGDTASPLNKAVVTKKVSEKLREKYADDLQRKRNDLAIILEELEQIDPEDDLQYELAKDEKNSIEQEIAGIRKSIKETAVKLRDSKFDIRGSYAALPTAPTVVPVVKVPKKSPLNPGGSAKPGLTLHAVIVRKSVDLNKAKAIARDIMKTKKDKFMRETSKSYRFRNVPKTKFSSFVTKVVNPEVSLVFGTLK